MKYKKSTPLPEKKGKDITLQSTIKINNDFNFLNILGISIICILGIVIYSNSFDCSFHFDDIPNIVENSMIHSIDLSALWKNSQNRFLGNYSFALNYHYGELDVWGYHLFNLIIHLINACLVYWLTLLIFSSPVLKDKAIAKDKNIIAFVTALLFISHPLATQSVTYIVQRLASMVTLFYLLSIALYIKGRLFNNNNIAKYLFFAAALISALMAMITKENSYTLPFSILLVEIYFLQTRKLSFNFRDYRFLIVLAVFLGVVAFAISRFSLSIFKPIPASFGNDYTITSTNYLLTQFSVIVKYIQLLFLPVNQNLDYDFPISNSFFEMRTLLSFLFLTSLFSLAVYLFNKQRIISFGIFWFFLCISIESSIIPIADVIFEHRTYLPSFGFFLIVSSGIYMLLWNKYKYLTIFLFLIIIGVNARLSFERNKIWGDDFALNSDIVAKSPNKPRTKVNMGMVFVNLDQWDKALPYFLEAKKMNPQYFDAVNNAGAGYLNFANWDSAIYYFTAAMQIDSTYSKVYYGRAFAYSRLMQWDKAITDFNKAIEIRPRYALALSGRALAYCYFKEYQKAISDYTQALKINPQKADYLCNRGKTYGNTTAYEKAIADFTKAIEIDNKYVEAYYYRGITYGNLGQWKNAADDFSKAIELDPNNKNAVIKRDNAIKQINNVK